MAVSITIHNVPDETRDELAARAAMGGQSMQEYLRELEVAGKPDNAVLLARIRARVRAEGSRISAAEILRLRDEARRDRSVGRVGGGSSVHRPGA